MKEMQEIHTGEKLSEQDRLSPKREYETAYYTHCRKKVSLPGSLKADPPILIIILSLPVIQPGKFHLLCEGDREGKCLNLIFCSRNNNCKFFPA